MTNSVKPATFDDIEELLNLMSEFYEESGYSLNRELSRRAFVDLLREPSFGQVWLIERKGQTAGYIVLAVGFKMEYGGKNAFLDDLFIRLEFRGKGLGRYGLKTLFGECRRRDIRAVHVEVGRNNEFAKKLYSKFGFQENSRQLLTRQLKEGTTAI